MSNRTPVTTGINPITLQPLSNPPANPLTLLRIHMQCGSEAPDKTIAVAALDPTTQTPVYMARFAEEHVVLGLRHLFTRGELDSDAAVQLLTDLVAWWKSGNQTESEMRTLIDRAEKYLENYNE